MTAGAETTLEDAIGYRFADPRLAQEVLTAHRTGRAGASRTGFERLEFLGDRVLGLVVAEVLLDRFPTEREGDLARRLSALVRREALLAVAERIGLAAFLPGEGGAVAAEGRVADAVEALVAAVYLDGGLAAARRLIETAWEPLIAQHSSPPQDAKTALQEWAQGRGLALPAYQTVAVSGPDHAPTFTVEVLVAGFAPEAASGGTKQVAEQAAAARLLLRFETA
ncbi:MAG: ribonuclease III [Alphaproteobacteria bacterium]|nr:ribonuclease III [Alphaproteobacteria bacterium]